MLLRKNDSGRSIVEMLGVLAIMGVITVMGIAGYSQAIGKINRNNVSEDIVRIAQEVRSTFAAKGDYLTGDKFASTESTYGNIGSILHAMNIKLTTPYGTNYKVISNGNSAGNHPGFYIEISGVPGDDCAYFLTNGWPEAYGDDYATMTNSADGSCSTTTTDANGNTTTEAKGTVIIRYV